jgi:DNA primase
MPGIDYSVVRDQVTISQVLELAGFVAVEQKVDQVRGPCPIHQSANPESRSFSANLQKNLYRCFSCGATGNQLDLWAAVSGMPIHAATKELCERMGIDLPLIRRW